MRVNVYAEEMTDKVEIISKEIEGQTFTGLRLYLELPATVDGKQYQGPFMHRPGDDDSSAVTFWGKRDLREVLRKALRKLDEHYEGKPYMAAPGALGWNVIEHAPPGPVMLTVAQREEIRLALNTSGTKQMTFGEAIRALKDGKRVAREGWNGRNMHLYLRSFVAGDYEPCIVMFTAQGKHQPGWLASQADMLATDWIIVER